jgi:predicted dehydrogenase
LKKGWHVFSELNLVDDGYVDNIQLARDKGLTLFLSSTFLYREEVRFIKKRVAENPKKVNYTYHVGQYLPDWHPWEHYSQFFVGDKRTNGCREIMAIELPWLVDVFGKIVDIEVRKGSMSSLPLLYPDNYVLTLVHDSGCMGLFALDVVTRKAARNFELFGEDLYLSWNGTPQGLFWYDVKTKKDEQITLYDNIDKQDNYSRTIIENAYYQEIVSFFSTIAGKENPIYSFEKDMQIIDLMNRIEG